MPHPYRGGPDAVSRFTLADGRTAVHIPRDKTHYSGLHRGYPLAEEFLDHLSEDGVEVVAIDDGEQIYVFDLYRYRWGSRVGHAPYPMKRVVSLDEATVGLRGSTGPTVNGSPEWLAGRDVDPTREQNGTNGGSSSPATGDEASTGR